MQKQFGWLREEVNYCLLFSLSHCHQNHEARLLL